MVRRVVACECLLRRLGLLLLTNDLRQYLRVNDKQDCACVNAFHGDYYLRRMLDCVLTTVANAWSVSFRLLTFYFGIYRCEANVPRIYLKYEF